jgi:rhodanese-related sulfurtransferase
MAIHSVDAVTLKYWLDRNEAVLVDVREPGEHAVEKIEGAVLLPLSSISKNTLPTVGNKKLVIHCHLGRRSYRACEKLLSEDPNLEVYNLEGGIDAWAKFVD